MPLQKSAEAIVGADTGRRAEHERTRVGDGIFQAAYGFAIRSPNVAAILAATFLGYAKAEFS